MQLRCERCSTVYTLDEKLLPPAGAPVQCTRCQHVFTAYPPQAAGRTAIFAAPRPPAGPPPPLGPPPPPLIPPLQFVPLTPSAPAAAGAPPQPFPPLVPQPGAPVPPRAPPAAHAPRTPAAEKPVSRPASPSAQPAGRPRPDTIVTFSAQVRTRRRWKWLGPLLVALVAAGGYMGWRWQSSRIAPAALQLRQQGLALLARDDSESLRRAAAAFYEALAIDGKLFQAEADRSLTSVLLAADARGEAAGLEARFRALDAERIRLEQEKSPGSPDDRDGVLQKMRLTKEELEPLQDRIRKLEDQAVATLRRLAGDQADDLSVARAVAVHLALAGDAEQCARVLQKARAAGTPDPWLDLAEAAVWAAPALPAEMRLQAQPKLGQLAAARPELLRARLLLARTQADLRQKEAAVATLDGLLAANPEHDQAKRLKAELLAPPPARPVASPAGTQAPPAPPRTEGQEALPRKAASSPR